MSTITLNDTLFKNPVVQAAIKKLSHHDITVGDWGCDCAEFKIQESTMLFINIGYERIRVSAYPKAEVLNSKNTFIGHFPCNYGVEMTWKHDEEIPQKFFSVLNEMEEGISLIEQRQKEFFKNREKEEILND